MFGTMLPVPDEGDDSESKNQQHADDDGDVFVGRALPFPYLGNRYIAFLIDGHRIVDRAAQ